MFYIRLFLWGLVAAMTLQGWLHADEYGTAATLVGGVTMTMSVWSESFVASMKGLLSSGPKFVGLPRALVAAALQESARHPIIKTLPRLKSTLEGHQKVWNAFRDVHVTWSLNHMDLIGGLQTEAAYLWSFWPSQQNATAVALNTTVESRCLMRSSTRSCTAIEEGIRTLTMRLEKEKTAEKAWAAVLGFHDSTSWQKAETWWFATQENGLSATVEDSGQIAVMTEGQVAVISRSASFAAFQEALRALHNVTDIADERIESLLGSIRSMPAPLNPWIHHLLVSLLEGDVWGAAMEHVRARESRVRELMIAAGVQELWAVHERIHAASLKALGESQKESRKLAEDWFGEIASYAWWLPDEVPGIVRRCIGQEGGDCSRIGPTEIQALLVQHREQTRILEDWTRRIFIGMWNAMPIIGILFALELIVLILPQKRVLHVWEETPQTSPLIKNS